MPGRSTTVRFRLATWLLLALPLTGCDGPQPTGRTPEEASSPAGATGIRVALVIGNGAYTQMRPLRNPVNDANAVGAALERSGFDVTKMIDADVEAMDDALERFRQVAARADIAMVFYSGHGAAIEGENYLIPVDARLRTRRSVQRQAVSLSSVLANAMQARATVVVLDACRNNPFGLDPVPNRPLGNGGMVQPTAVPPGELLIAYATAPRQTADDGEGLYSPYTASLLEHLEMRDLSLMEMFRLTADATLARTEQQQRPWTEGSLSQRYCLTCEAPPAVEPVPERADAAPPEADHSLHQAVAAGDIAGVQRLLLAGADVNAPDELGATPLHLAVAEGGIAVVQELLAAGAGVNFADNDGLTPLHLAAGWDDATAVNALLSAGANVHARDNGGRVPYSLRSSVWSFTRSRALVTAIRPHHIPAPDDGSWVSLHAMGVRPAGGATPLHWAAGHDSSGAVEALVAGGSDGTATARLFPVPPFTPDGQIRPLSAATALHWAAEVDATDAVRTLLAGGADVDARDSYGATVLHRAAQRGASRTVAALLAAGADVALTSYRGETALHMAAGSHEAEIVELLLAAGAAVDVRVGGGETPLHWAMSMQDIRTPERAPDAVPAVSLRAVRTLQTLFEHGADAGLVNSAGETPLDLAVRTGNVALAEIGASAGPYWRAAGARSAAAASRAPRREVGEVFRECAACPLMTVVPAGTFLMSSPPWARRETIAAPFAVGVYEVTFAEWDTCVAEGGCNGYRPDDNGWGRDARPVIHVSWGDAQAYLRWLSRKTGGDYRLLTEAEWEYAARAGTTAARYWGGSDFGLHYDTEQCNHANGADRSYEGQAPPEEEEGTERFVACDDGAAATAPVGSYLPNAFGLHDVLGNVWEWTSGCGPPASAEVCPHRVVRGGSWYARPGSLRAGRRAETDAGDRNFFDRGFRVARVLQQLSARSERSAPSR